MFQIYTGNKNRTFKVKKNNLLFWYQLIISATINVKPCYVGVSSMLGLQRVFIMFDSYEN
jgi:hypothetical protein